MASSPSLIVAAMSAIATFTLAGSGIGAASVFGLVVLHVVVPLLSVVLGGTPDTYHSGRSRAGDRHLKIHDYRDNHAHTVFLAGVPWSAGHRDGMFANLRETVRVSMADLAAGGRVAAMTHDCRVSVIRRELYYRYRWLVSREDVQANEASRVSNDSDFVGPRPPWGALVATAR